MLLLALDTATAAVAVAVHDGERALSQVQADDGPGAMPRHGELLAPAIQRALELAGVGVGELTHVVVGVGPGPFTGLRVGLVTAVVLARTQDVPVIGVCTLDALAGEALAATGGDGVAVVTDARRREVYVARYDATGRRTWGPRVLRPPDAVAALGGLRAVGPGALLYQDLFVAGGVSVGGPAAVAAAALASFAAARLHAGEPLPAGAAPYAVGGAHDDGAATTVPWGLLPAVPLYLRRPDAVPSVPVPSVGVPSAPDPGEGP